MKLTIAVISILLLLGLLLNHYIQDQFRDLGGYDNVQTMADGRCSGMSVSLWQTGNKAPTPEDGPRYGSPWPWRMPCSGNQ